MRDADLDDELIVLSLCLWFGAFWGQLVLLLDGGMEPLGWPVFSGRLRVRYVLKDSHPFELLFEHALEFRPLIGNDNLHQRVGAMPDLAEAFPCAFRVWVRVR